MDSKTRQKLMMERARALAAARAVAARRPAPRPLPRLPGVAVKPSERPRLPGVAVKPNPGAPLPIPQRQNDVPYAPWKIPAYKKLVRPQPVKAAHTKPPANNRQALDWGKPMPLVSVLQGMPVQVQALAGAPTQVQPLSGAPIAVSTVGFAGSLANMNVDTSVSAQVRAAKQLGALIDNGVPVSGDYTDAIRNAAGFAFGPPRLPGQGYAAASYSYPSKAMVVGATLAGAPIVAPPPRLGPPKLVMRPGLPERVISSSPSEDRKRILSTLQGMTDVYGQTRLYGMNGAFDFLTPTIVDRVGQVPEGESPWPAGSPQANYCQRTYPPTATELLDKANDSQKEQTKLYWRCMADGFTDPDGLPGQQARGLPKNWSLVGQYVKQATDVVRGSGLLPVGQQPCPPGQVRNPVTQQCGPLQRPQEDNTMLIVGGIAAAAAIGVFAITRMK